MRRDLPRLAAGSLSVAGGTEYSLGDNLLEPALLRVGGRPAAARYPRAEQPRADAGLLAFYVRFAAGLLSARGRDSAPRDACCAADHEFYGRAQADRLLRLGAAPGYHLDRSVSRADHAHLGNRAHARPDALAQGRAAAPGDGASAEPGQLDGAESAEATWCAAFAEHAGGRAWRRRSIVFPMAAIRGRGGDVS